MDMDIWSWGAGIAEESIQDKYGVMMEHGGLRELACYMEGEV